jgi:hypothetical protein
MTDKAEAPSHHPCEADPVSLASGVPDSREFAALLSCFATSTRGDLEFELRAVLTPLLLIISGIDPPPDFEVRLLARIEPCQAGIDVPGGSSR